MAGTTGAIRAGRAFIELFADDSRLVRGLQAAWDRGRASAGTRTEAAQMPQDAILGRAGPG